MKTANKSAVMHLTLYTVFASLFLCVSLVLGVLSGSLTATVNADTVKASAPVIENKSSNITADSVRILVIDPGHGGEDGGASSANGILEKDLNLALSDDIASMCLMFGVPYKMTREDDRLLYDYYSEYTDYTGKKKSLDLKNRLKLTEEVGASLFLGIHMNKFTDPRYSGLQVYYSPNNDESRQIAEVIQTYVKSHLQKDNDRAAKKATSSIFLLNRLNMPSVLVECGFLSNEAEAAKLNTQDYRASLACSVFTPVLEYFVRLDT